LRAVFSASAEGEGATPSLRSTRRGGDTRIHQSGHQAHHAQCTQTAHRAAARDQPIFSDSRTASGRFWWKVQQSHAWLLAEDLVQNRIFADLQKSATQHTAHPAKI
jgi:hypothetical protein